MNKNLTKDIILMIFCLFFTMMLVEFMEHKTLLHFFDHPLRTFGVMIVMGILGGVLSNRLQAYANKKTA